MLIFIALAHLCEFIEDCEFTKLSVRILHLLGMEGPTTSHPTKYIRYIYNRVVLENAIVRAAAVTALAKFGIGQKDPEIKKSVHVLLTRCLDDTDDEVRDRAALNLRLMTEDDDVSSKFVRHGKFDIRGSCVYHFLTHSTDSMFSLPVLEHQLAVYLTGDSFGDAFDMSTVPVVTRAQADAEDRTKKLTTAMPTLKAIGAGPNRAAKVDKDSAIAAAAATQKYAEQLQKVPEIAAFGGVLKSSAVVELTESETEYVVTAIKHIFKDNIVLQFDVKNTLPEIVLTNVSISAVPTDSHGEVPLEEDFIVPITKLTSDAPATAYVAFKRTDSEPLFFGASFTNSLKFTSREIDPSTGEPEESGYEDEYQIEDLELSGADYVVPAFAGSFDNIWDQVGSGEELSETLQLGNMKSIAGKHSILRFSEFRLMNLSDATEQLTKALSLQPLDGTDIPVNTSTHTLKLYGKTIAGGKVAAIVRMAFSAKTGVTTKLTVRAEEEGISALVIASVA